MPNEREYIVVSRDGTIHHAHDCIILHANAEQVYLLEHMHETERFAIIQTLEDTATLDEIMYDIVMKEA